MEPARPSVWKTPSEERICSTATIVSAPGKVLLSGGYLVVERPNEGCVMTVDARMFVRVASTDAVVSQPESTHMAFPVSLRSPQFGLATTYQFSFESNKATLTPNSGNNFVELTLLHLLALACRKHGFATTRKLVGSGGLHITILGDDAFYGNDVVKSSSGRAFQNMEAPRFSIVDSGSDLSALRKTGLGSSAALTTALAAALLQHLELVELFVVADHGPGRQMLHTVAQYLHCLAQESVGSGFDIAAAVFGSQVYTRFTPFPLPSSASARQGLSEADMDAFWERITMPLDSTHRAVRLPKDLVLMLGDVNQGSKTPGLVKKVMAWRSKLVPGSEDEEQSPWGQLRVLNARAVACLTYLSRGEHLPAYEAALAVCRECNDWDALLVHVGGPALIKTLASRLTLSAGVSEPADGAMTVTIEGNLLLLMTLRSLFQRIRKQFSRLGSLADPSQPSFTEPPEQAELCDATMKVPGALVCGVPGAGGRDAVFAIVVAGSQVALADVWRARGVRPMGLTEDNDGIVLHDNLPVLQMR